ncbi:MAG: PQQ-binding-like beta-propeller repeat protein [Bdellovibrio sp.]|nr:PQQ-binding-like beta-propeller repeat protein [Bdellovibrio sp.]
MFTQKFITFILVVGFLGGCTSMSEKKTAKNQNFVVTPFWSQDTLSRPNVGFRKINRMSPILYRDQIVVGNALDGLVSYDIQTKNETWRIDIPYGVESSGTQIRDRLFVGSNNGRMYSIDLGKGSVVWSFDTKSELVAEPLLHEGVLYFLSGSQSVFALDAVSGKQLWTYNRQDTSNLMTIRGGSRPAFSNGMIYVGFSDGSIVSINSKTGTPQWEITLNRNTRFKDIDSSPIVDGDFIYVNSYDDQLYCISKDKGEIIWKSPFGGSSTPLIFSDKIATTSSGGDLAVLLKREGTVVWKTKTQSGLFIDPGLMKGLLVTGESQGKLMFFDSLSGEVKGSFEPGRGVFSKPSISNDKTIVYFISGEGNVYGVKAQFDTKSSVYYLR